jgi:topoisomerase-4 subunit A
VYSVAASTLPGGRGDGVAITTLVDLEAGTQVAHYWAGPAERTLLLANSGGFGLLAKAGDMHGRNRGGKAFLTLEDGDQLLAPQPMNATHKQLACLSADGRLLVFALDELKLQPNGGRGLTLMADIDAQAPLLAVQPMVDQVTVLGTGRGAKPKEELLRLSGLAAHVGKRARKGKAVDGMQKVLGLA